MNVKVEKSTIDGVRVFIVTPAAIAPGNQNRVLIHMHGGCYVLNPREAGLPEAIFMAGFGHIKVITACRRKQCSPQPSTTASRSGRPR